MVNQYVGFTTGDPGPFVRFEIARSFRSLSICASVGATLVAIVRRRSSLDESSSARAFQENTRDDASRVSVSAVMDSVPNFFGGDAGAFGGGSADATGTNGEVILCEVKCGRLNRDGTTMKADKRKGLLRVTQAAVDDTLKQIQWGARDPSMAFEAEEDFITIPDEAVLKPMKKAGCFMLTFIEERDRDMYFWFQESNETDKEELLNKFNRQINTNVMAALGGAGFGGVANEQEQATEAIMEDAAPTSDLPSETPAASTLMPPPPNVIPSPVDPTPAPTQFVSQTPAAPAKVTEGMRTPASAANFTPIVSSDTLKGVFANLGGSTPRTPPVGLPDILTPELVGPLLRDEQIRGRLLEYLPEEHRETQDLEELIRTPQFRSQLESFSQALQSGEMDLAQFGLKQSGAADLENFLSAIQAEVAPQEEEKQDDAMES